MRNRIEKQAFPDRLTRDVTVDVIEVFLQDRTSSVVARDGSRCEVGLSEFEKKNRSSLASIELGWGNYRDSGLGDYDIRQWQIHF